MRTTVAIISAFLLCSCGAFDLYESLIFRLYKRELPSTYTLLNTIDFESVRNEFFDPKLPTRIYIHGYLGSKETIERYRHIILSMGNYNFIAIDWTEGARAINYFIAKSRIPFIAEKLAGLIDALVARGMDLKDLTMIGHSLGAHMAGLAAKKIKSGNSTQVDSIIGLDPASIGFSFEDVENRLDKSDAEYVQVIHTDIDMYGFNNPIGHADFYPNGGNTQPGCPTQTLKSLLEGCSHTRATELFWQSLTTNFTAIKCASYEELRDNRCIHDNITVTMGGDITVNRPHGIFYLETTESAPFVIADYTAFKYINNQQMIEENKENLRTKSLKNFSKWFSKVSFIEY